MTKRIGVFFIALLFLSGCKVGWFDTKTFYVHFDHSPVITKVDAFLPGENKHMEFKLKDSINNGYITDTIFRAFVKNKNCQVIFMDTATWEKPEYYLDIKAKDWKGRLVKIYIPIK